mmetsp:Transcript_12482/g.28938  ORF Transcript_12482/g.28938 Transcript_12482/m.28938 type:complete len:122 (+) Transcript_12482:56-421(+)
MASRKIPSHMTRELQRHVASSSTTTKKNHSGTAIFVVGFVAVAASVPFLCVQWIGNLNNRDESLSASQIRRGAFNNSGSKDIGRDPKWSRGTYDKKELEELFRRDDGRVQLDEKFFPATKR